MCLRPPCHAWCVCDCVRVSTGRQEADPAAFLRSAVGVSQMASMLHDTRRNDAYFRAIRAAVAGYRAAHGRAPVVLDIGAGTGLLVRSCGWARGCAPARHNASARRVGAARTIRVQRRVQR
jgi:hypothetical protein